MKDLEKFIRMHRNEFDVYQPRTEVWAGILSGLAVPAPVSKLVKLLGPGSKNLILALAVTSTALIVGVWTYQSNKSPKSSPAIVTQSPNIKEASADPEVKGKAPVPEGAKQIPFIRKETPIPDTENKEQTDEAAIPIEKPQADNPQPYDKYIPTAYMATEPGDSTYNGVKKLTLKSFGYNFRIKRSDTKTTRVHVLKPGKVVDKKTNSNLVLKIEQQGSELVIEYEGEENRQIWGTNYKTIDMGEIEILIPDGEVNEITAISSNIDLDGYTTPALTIETTSGNVNASDVTAKLRVTSVSGNEKLTKISGDLKCNAASGNIGIKNLHGNAKIETSSGDIVISNSQGDVTCENVAGNIRLDGVQGKIDLHTSSGSVIGESVTLVESCNIETVSGNIDRTSKQRRRSSLRPQFCQRRPEDQKRKHSYRREAIAQNREWKNPRNRHYCFGVPGIQVMIILLFANKKGRNFFRPSAPPPGLEPGTL